VNLRGGGDQARRSTSPYNERRDDQRRDDSYYDSRTPPYTQPPSSTSFQHHHRWPDPAPFDGEDLDAYPIWRSKVLAKIRHAFPDQTDNYKLDYIESVLSGGPFKRIQAHRRNQIIYNENDALRSLDDGYGEHDIEAKAIMQLETLHMGNDSFTTFHNRFLDITGDLNRGAAQLIYEFKTRLTPHLQSKLVNGVTYNRFDDFVRYVRTMDQQDTAFQQAKKHNTLVFQPRQAAVASATTPSTRGRGRGRGGYSSTPATGTNTTTTTATTTAPRAPTVVAAAGTEQRLRTMNPADKLAYIRSIGKLTPDDKEKTRAAGACNRCRCVGHRAVDDNCPLQNFSIQTTGGLPLRATDTTFSGQENE